MEGCARPNSAQKYDYALERRRFGAVRTSARRRDKVEHSGGVTWCLDLWATSSSLEWRGA